MREEYLERDIMPELLKWLDRREIYAIKGPRQSGKTTILKMLKDFLIEKGVEEEKIIFINFEDRDILEEFVKDPKTFVESFLTGKQRHYFLLDEYHYVREGGQKLKLLYDSFENIKFIITGSSSLELAGAMAKFLVGRVFFFELLPFSFHEFLLARSKRLARIYEKNNKAIKDFIFKESSLATKKDIFLDELKRLLDEYIIFGGYPEVIKTKDIETKKFILKNIYDTYISKDIIEFLKITDANKYRNIVKFIALLAGNLINYNEIASACQGYYKEVKRILSICEETYIAKLLTPFYKNPVTELRKNPKVYFFDLGLRNYIINNFNSLDRRGDAGSLAENFVFLGLRNLGLSQINYWRTIAKAEVDFVLNSKIPLEVKYTETAKISRSLRSFIKTYKPKKAVIASKGWASKKLNGTIIKTIPIYYL